MGKGKPKRRMTYGSPDEGVTLSDARRYVLTDRARIEQGVNPAEERKENPSGTLTVTQLIELYEKHELEHGAKRNGKPRRPSYVAKVKRRMKLIRAAWGPRDAASIEQKDITRFLDEYAARPAMQGDMWTFINILFGFAAGR